MGGTRSKQKYNDFCAQQHATILPTHPQFSAYLDLPSSDLQQCAMRPPFCPPSSAYLDLPPSDFHHRTSRYTIRLLVSRMVNLYCNKVVFINHCKSKNLFFDTYINENGLLTSDCIA